MPDSEDRTARGRLIGLVVSILGEAAPSGPVPADARLSDLGMTSIKMVNLMLAVESAFELSIPQSEITPDNFRSIATIEALLRRLGAPSD